MNMVIAIFNIIIIIIIYLVISTNGTKESIVRKLVYQKDFSEHCRRHVVPSIFLGRKVHNANSKMLHFSRLELPYSCFISVRTELGSNIILVVQVISGKDLEKSCSKNANPLEVFELSETFGGYWGPLPDSVLRQRPTADHEPYILKSTESSTKTNIDTEESKIQLLTKQKTFKKTSKLSPDEGFINIEIPLVNVSAKLVPGELPPTKAFDIDEIFDVIYDVTPKEKDVNYDTRIMPILQFSLADRSSSLNILKSENKYDLDYKIPNFTPDPRENRNSRLSSRSIFRSIIRGRTNILDHYRTYYLQNSLTRKNNEVNPSTTYSFNKGKNTGRSEINDNESNFSLIDVLTKKKHNFSVYLSPDLSIYTKDDLGINNPLFDDSSIAKISSITTTPLPNHYRYHESLPQNLSEKYYKSKTEKNVVIDNKSILSSSSKSDLSENIYRNSSEGKLLYHANSKTSKSSSKHNYVAENIIRINENPSTSNSTMLHSSLKPGSTVDHKSWENVIQAVPVMEVALNQTDDKLNTDNAHKKKSNRSKRKSRPKRYIHAIPIEAARPHTLSTMENTKTTTTITAYFSDVQKFAQLIELQDDEIQSRAALRYLGQYVGPSLFNVCDLEHFKTRHVLIFNTSRIVIAIRNFSLERMNLVLTTARTLTGSGSRCPLNNLECQVLGTRVCIDSVSACDGVPNCGAFDIYDEDRLQCGEALGLQHNVCLAAFTFLAVLLTMLYIVNYWLKRCVPKVSKAFFIYTDGIENILYLNTVMRSPGDDDNDSKLAFHNGFDEDLYMFTSDHEVKKGIKRILEKFSRLLSFTKRKPEIKPAQTEEYQLRKMYSFTEYEIHKMTGKGIVDEAVQTGDSLEINVLDEDNKSPKASISKNDRLTVSSNKKIKVDFDNNLRTDSIVQTNSKSRKQTEGLNVERSARDSTSSFNIQSGSAHSKSKRLSYQPTYLKSLPEERELRATELNMDANISENRSNILNLTSEVYSEKSEVSSHAKKRLRFEELAHTISDSEEILDTPCVAMRGTHSRLNTKNFRSNIVDEHQRGHTSGSGRDFKRFWSGLKSKKKNQK